MTPPWVDSVANLAGGSGRRIELPPLGLGGAALGGLHGPVSEAEAEAALEAAWNGGIRYLDTAPLYGAGLGELRFGAFLRAQPRESYVLSTKVGWLVRPLEWAERPGSLPFGRVVDYSFDGTMRSIEDSLSRLGIERIDIALVHDVDPYNHGADYGRRRAEALDGALPALERLRDQGLVRAIGVAVNNCDVCLDFLEHARPDLFLLAGRHSLLDREAERALLPECARRGVGIIVGAPFNTGILAKGPTGKFNHGAAPPDVLARVQAMQRVCTAHGTSLMAAALHFVLRHPVVVGVLPGPRSADQVRSVVEAFGETIPEGLWPDLETVAASAEPTR
jgi:D-threo-aldose 1-dehydrogenase